MIMSFCATRGRVYFPLSKKHEKHFRADELERCTTLGRENQTSVCAFTVCAYLKTQVCVAVSVTCVLCCWQPARCYCRFPFISPTFSLSLTGATEQLRFSPQHTHFSSNSSQNVDLDECLPFFLFTFSAWKWKSVQKKKKKQRSEKEFRQVKMVAYIWSEEQTNKV